MINKFNNVVYHIEIVDVDIIVNDIEVNAIADIISDDLSFSVKLSS